MQELLMMFGFFVFAAVASYALSRLVAKKPATRPAAHFMPGQPVRIKASDGLYRARFLKALPDGFAFGAPIQRDRYVPLRIGEKLVVEAPTANGLYWFRTEVAGRNPDSHEIVLATPKTIHFENRRLQNRIRGAERPLVVEEGPAWLADIATQGVCLTTDKALRPGERIRVDVEGKEPAFAWVLDCEPNTNSGKGKHRVRARFEEERIPAGIEN